MRIIEVIVSPVGEITVQTKGFVGQDCVTASQFLEQALGVVHRERKTAEFYQTSRRRTAGPAVTTLRSQVASAPPECQSHSAWLFTPPAHHPSSIEPKELI